MKWMAIDDLAPQSTKRHLVRLSNRQGSIDYLVGWWDNAHWVFEDLQGNAMETRDCNPTHWSRIEPPRP